VSVTVSTGLLRTNSCLAEILQGCCWSETKKLETSRDAPFLLALCTTDRLARAWRPAHSNRQPTTQEKSPWHLAPNASHPR
jgi:hypothetical protein